MLLLLGGQGLCREIMKLCSGDVVALVEVQRACFVVCCVYCCCCLLCLLFVVFAVCCDRCLLCLLLCAVVNVCCLLLLFVVVVVVFVAVASARCTLTFYSTAIKARGRNKRDGGGDRGARAEERWRRTAIKAFGARETQRRRRQRCGSRGEMAPSGDQGAGALTTATAAAIEVCGPRRNGAER